MTKRPPTTTHPPPANSRRGAAPRGDPRPPAPTRLWTRVDRTLHGRHWPGLALFAGAFLLKLAYVAGSAGSVQFQVPLMDSKYYLEMADRIMGGGLLRPEAFFMGPLYPYWIALVFSVFGKNLLLLRVLQVAGGSMTVVLTYLLGKRLCRPSVGLLAALFLALYGAMTFYEGLYLMMWMGTLLNIGAIHLLVARRERAGALAFALPGLLLGLSALARASILAFVPAVAIWILALAGRRRRVARTLVFLAAVAAPVSLATLHNGLASRDFVLITSNAGINYYIGNNPRATGVFEPIWGIDFERDTTTEAYVERRMGRELRPSEVSRYWFDLAFEFMRESPGRWLGLQIEKVRIFLNAYEIPQIESFDVSRERYAPLRVLFVSFWFLLAFGMLGLAFGAPSWKRSFLLLGYLVTYSLSIILFFVTARYRIQIAPVLAIFAGLGVVRLFEVAAASRQKLYAAAGALFFLLLLTRPGLSGLGREDLAWTEHVHQARRFGLVGRYDEALREIDRAVAIHPDLADSYIHRAIIRKGRGDLEGAAADYEEAIRFDPENPSSHYDLGQILRELGAYQTAVREYRKAIALDSLKVEAYNNLGVAYRKLGEYDRAAESFRVALRLDPGHIKGYNNLGAALAEARRFDEAIRVFEEAIRLDPEYALTYKNLALAYLQQKKLAKGAQSLEAYLAREPDDRKAQALLATLRKTIEAQRTGPDVGSQPGRGSDEDGAPPRPRDPLRP